MSYGKKTENITGGNNFTPITAGQANPGFKFESFSISDTNPSRAIITFSKGDKEFQVSYFESDQEWAQELTQNAILHIATKMGSETEFWAAVEKSTSFQDWVSRVNNFMQNNATGKTFTLKIVYNKNGYLSFPRYPRFIELDGTNPSTLSTNPKYDFYVKPEGASKPDEIPAGASNDGLPF